MSENKPKVRPSLTAERLRAVLELNHDEGRFYWKVNTNSRRMGEQAGTLDSHGYGQIQVDGRLYREHRLVWLYITGAWPIDQVDHINHQRRDNRIENLREVSQVVNQSNVVMSCRNTSGFVGVSFHKREGIYKATISVNGKQIHLGSFKDFDEAVQARKAANEKYGFHANHGVGRRSSPAGKGGRTS